MVSAKKCVRCNKPIAKGLRCAACAGKPLRPKTTPVRVVFEEVDDERNADTVSALAEECSSS